MSEVQVQSKADQLRNEVFQLSDAGAISEDDVHSDKELQRTFRELAKRSLYFLCKSVLGYKDLTIHTHWEFCRLVQDSSIRAFLGLLPRGCFKTSIGTVGWPIQCLIRDPNDTIMLSNQIETNAQLMLVEIEHHLDGSNNLMNWLFPEMIKPNDRYQPWSKEMMVVPNRTEYAQRAPSIMAKGVGGRAESLHFRKIIVDDPVGEKAMESEIEMLTATVWHDYAISLFVEPEKDIERVYGTRWGPTDFYQPLIDSRRYTVYWQPAEKPDVLLPSGKHWLFFPERLGYDFLRELKNRNYPLYMGQYQNDPVSPGGLEFDVKWLNTFRLERDEKRGPVARCPDGLDCFCDEMAIGIFVDPAGSDDIDKRAEEDVRRAQAKKSTSVVHVVGVHGSGRWFSLDMWHGRTFGENPELQLANQMYKMARTWRGLARRGYLEAFGAQSSLITIYNMVCRQNEFGFKYEPLPKGEKRAKTVRIRAAVGGVAQQGLLYYRTSQDLLFYEFTHFPKSDARDSLDTLTWAINTLRGPVNKLRQMKRRLEVERAINRRLRVVTKAGY